MKKVKVSAPGKLMLFGEHAVVYNRPCLVTAVDQRIRVFLEKSASSNLEIEASDVGVRRYRKKIDSLGKKADIPKGVRFLEQAVKIFFQEYKIASGLKIKTESEFSSEFGFGSSSAVTVATLTGLFSLFGIKLSKKKLFDLSYKTVLEIQGMGSGFDLAAAIWGGTLYFITGGQKILPLKIKRLPLVVGYTGLKADTPALVEKVAILRENNKELVEGIFDKIALLAEKARIVLEKGDFKKAGELANINQGLLECLGVNTKKLADLVFAARQAGAYGAKLSGAGGGDCMVAFVSTQKEKVVEQAIRQVGGLPLKVKVNEQGVRFE